MENTSALDEVVDLASRLSPRDKARLISNLAGELATQASPRVRTSFIGICADLGLSPSDEDIAEARREMAEGWL
jgi:hypothetical protein